MSPNSSASAYCDSVTALKFVARQIWADNLREIPEAPRPSYLAMIDPANPAGDRLILYLNEGAGEIEAACGIAQRYLPADLAALTGVSQVLLQKINAARALWQGYQFLRPGSADQKACPGATESEELLKALRDGELIFGFFETQQAGLPEVKQAQPSKLLTPNVVGRAARLFPSYGMNRLSGQGD